MPVLDVLSLLEQTTRPEDALRIVIRHSDFVIFLSSVALQLNCPVRPTSIRRIFQN
jgi:hypothetical protein